MTYYISTDTLDPKIHCIIVAHQDKNKILIIDEEVVGHPKKIKKELQRCKEQYKPNILL